MFNRNAIWAVTSAALLSAALVTAPHAVAQAHVVENQSIYVYVDGTAGSDSNPGTASQPLKTIQAAANQAMANSNNNVGTKVEVLPGRYREFVNIGWTRYTPTITIEATVPGTAVITGAESYSNWYQTSNPSVYGHSFAGLGWSGAPTSWPTNLPSITYRKEVVTVNDVPLTQVMSASQLQAGTFFVDDRSHQLEIFPAAGTDMTMADVEVAVRPHILSVKSRGNLVLRGLAFTHAASQMGDNSADVYSSNNVLIDQVQANWNNWGGFQVHSSDYVTVQNSVASYNGGQGFSGFRLRQALIQFDEADYNNWRGALGAFYDFGMGGFKFFMSHGVDVESIFAYNNQAQGLWFDTDNRQITINNALVSGNVVDNLQIELNHGPISISNSTVCYGQVGMYQVNASQVSLTGNTFYGNGGSTAHMMPQYYLSGKPGGRHFIDWETGIYYNVISSDTTFSNNTFEDSAANQYVFGTFQSGSDWYTFARSFHSDKNQWYDPMKTNAFALSSGKVSLSTWKSTTGEDSNSNWVSVAPPSCQAPPPAYKDFHVLTDQTRYTMNKSTANVPLKIKQFGDASAPITLSTVGLPAGVSATVTTGSGTQAGSAQVISGAVQVKAERWVAEQAIPVQVVAQRNGQVHSVTVTVNVRH